jgi:MSHA biogenesis protein MshE
MQELGEAVNQHNYMHSKGCSYCNHTGYQGRIGVYELLEMNNDLVEAANHHDTNYFIQKARERMQGETLRSQSVQLVIAKKTSITEAMRINNLFDE